MKGKTRIIANYYRTDLVICRHSRERNTPSYSQINMVMSFFFKVMWVEISLKGEVFCAYQPCR